MPSPDIVLGCDELTDVRGVWQIWDTGNRLVGQRRAAAAIGSGSLRLSLR